MKPIIVLSLALLAACQAGLNSKQRDEVQDIVDDSAVDPDEVASLKARVDQLKDRLDRAGIAE